MSRRIRKSFGLAVAGLALASFAQAQDLCMSASIDAAQQGTNSTASGQAYFFVDRAANTLTYHITIQGLSTNETAAHIHGFAPPGQNGPVVHGLPLGTTKKGTWNYPPGDEADILAGLTYVNIHTSMFPGGEIRGQIEIVYDSAFMVASIDGPQEPSNSPGTGTGIFFVDTAANAMAYAIDFADLLGNETVAHIHGFAPPGQNAGVKHSLPIGSPKIGVWNYPQSDEADILAGLAYVNIHSSMFPGGEIRGQILLGCTNPTTYCVAKVNSCGTTPFLDSTGFPSAGATSGFEIRGNNARGLRFGLLLYGNSGPANIPFQGGTLCVSPPLRRATPVNSGGTNGLCDGTFVTDMNAFASGNGGGNPQPFLTVVGTPINTQYWGRDTPGNGSYLSDGLLYVVAP